MAEKKTADEKTQSQSMGDKLLEKGYRDYDMYNWAGQQTDKGSDVRRKGTDV